MAKTRGKSVTDATEKKLRNLKPFKPRQSGNPKVGLKVHAIAWAQRLASPSSELRRIVVGVTEITDEGGLTKWRENARDAFGITQLAAGAHESSAQSTPSHYLFAHGAATAQTKPPSRT